MLCCVVQRCAEASTREKTTPAVVCCVVWVEGEGLERSVLAEVKSGAGFVY